MLEKVRRWKMPSNRLCGLLIVCGVVLCCMTIFKDPGRNLADVVEAVRPAVVHVEKLGNCEGSGCLISPDGIIFTAKHVSGSAAGDYKVTLDDGRVFRVLYVIEDRQNDIAFMKLDLAGAEPNLPFARMGDEGTMRVGDSLFIFGSPLGRENINTVSTGILSAKDRNLHDRRDFGPYRRYNWHVMLQTTSPAFPGNSGGPCFNVAGEVIGVLVAGYAETLNFAVPIARFSDQVETIRRWFELSRWKVVQPYEENTTDMAGMPVEDKPMWCSKGRIPEGN